MLDVNCGHHVRVIKTRLTPTTLQADLLLNYTTAVNAIYNTLLFKTKEEYENRKTPNTQNENFTCQTGIENETIGQDETLPIFHAYALEKKLTAVKHDWFDWADQVPAQVFTEASHRLAHAFTKMREGQTRYPRFRKRHKQTDAGKQSVTFKKKHNETWLSHDGRHIALPVSQARRTKLGLAGNTIMWVGMRRDKRIKRVTKLITTGRAQIQKVTFSYSGGYWWAAIRLRVDNRNRTQHPTYKEKYVGGVVGVDIAFGNRAMVLSQPVKNLTNDEGIIVAPQHLKKRLGQIGEVQRQHRRTRTGSNNNKRLLKRLRKLHHIAVAERKRWHHNIANELVCTFDTIVVEDLNVKGLAKRKVGRKFSYGLTIADLAPTSFITILSNKTVRDGRTFVKADRFYPSSKKCSQPNCGMVKTKLCLSDRIYRCESCGNILDRDVNAARNLAQYNPHWKSVKVTTRDSGAGTPHIGVSKGERSRAPIGTITKVDPIVLHSTDTTQRVKTKTLT